EKDQVCRQVIELERLDMGERPAIALSHHGERGQASAIAADAQFRVDGLVFEGSCSEVFLDPGWHVFRPRLPMTDRRLPGAAGLSARALRTAVGCGWPVIRIVLRRGSGATATRALLTAIARTVISSSVGSSTRTARIRHVA